MTRNIQCREMTEDVQRQMAGLSFQDNKNADAYNNYPSGMSMANLLIRGGKAHTTMPMHNNLDLILGLLTPSQLHTLLLTKVATISNNSVTV